MQITNNRTGGIGIYAISPDNGGEALKALSYSGYGVHAISSSNTAVFAESTSFLGVYARSISNTAIFGTTAAGGNVPAVVGYASSASLGVGVKGQAVSGGTGVWGYNPGAVAGWFDGNLYMNGSLVLTSDARLKKEVRDLSYGTADLLKLHPVMYKWKSGDDITHLGLIAQEVEKVIPEVVSHSRGPSSDVEMLAVNYNELLPLMIKTVQEQNKVIVLQEGRIAALERSRSPIKLTSILYDLGGGGAMIGLLPLGLVVAYRRRKREARQEIGVS